MALDDPGRKQATARLRIVNQRLAQLTAEKDMLEQYLANSDRRSFRRSASTLRKNSSGKWTTRERITRFLRDHGKPEKASAIYDTLRLTDGSLKQATFRSHMKRLADEGIIERMGPRGCYQLTRKPDEKEPFDEPRTKPFRLKPTLSYV